MFIEQRSPFVLFQWERWTFVCLLFIIILCCIDGYSVNSVSKPAINNLLISKDKSVHVILYISNVGK